MKKLNYLLLIGLVFIIAGCNNSDNIEDQEALIASELQIDDKIDDLTISKITLNEDYLEIEFSDELVIEGAMYFDLSPTMISIDYTLFKSKINFKDTELDLSEYDNICLVNYEEITKYIPLEWKVESTTDYWQLDEEKNGNIKIKLKINDIIFSNDNMSPVQAKIKEVIAFDGKDNPEVVTDHTIISAQVKLDMVAFGTDGAWALFKDKEGNTITIFDNGNNELHDNIKDIKPNSTDHQYQNTWFDMEYNTMSLPFYDGGTGETVYKNVETITSFKPAE